jgi:hypothetical protein
MEGRFLENRPEVLRGVQQGWAAPRKWIDADGLPSAALADGASPDPVPVLLSRSADFKVQTTRLTASRGSQILRRVPCMELQPNSCPLRNT